MIPLTDEDNIWTYEFLRHAIEPVVTEQLRLVNKAIAPVRLTAVAEITSEHEEKLGEEQRQFLLKSREQVASLFSKVQKRLPEFGLDTVYSLSSVLQSINPEQREFLFSQFILPNLGTIVDSAESWNILLSNLSVSQRQTVNDFVYRRKLLPKMFVRASDVICGPFKYLSEKQRLDIFQTFKYRLTQSIHSFYDLSNFISNNALSKKNAAPYLKYSKME